jgi:protein OPY2
VRIYGGASHGTIDLDPQSRGDSMAATNGHVPERHSTQSNPFVDTQSIQSASTGTRSNVIPIALVPHGAVSTLSGPISTKATQGSIPARPERSPDVDLGLQPAGASTQLSPLAGKMDANSTRSGVTANFRNSYMTTGSFASDIMNEAPVIVTPTRGTVKQVVGVVRAEVIRPPTSAGSGSVYSTDEQGTPKTASSLANRPSIRSPLAKNDAFGPMDSMAEEPEHSAEAESQELSIRQNPFSDEYSPYRSDAPSSPAPAPSPAATTATFGESEEQHWDPQSPRLPWKKERERPASAYTQAASIIDANIGTASRVHLGLNQLSPQSQATGRSLLSAPPPSSDFPITPNSAPLSTRSQYRMTSAKLVSPASGNLDATPLGGTLERQQKKAFANLDARMSQASVASSASTRADSILEGFHFVPPSPISDRPLRTPPRSPLAQQAFSDASSTAANSSATTGAGDDPLPLPNRKTLGMSTGSQLSTMSNGLSSFPFQIDAGNGAPTEAASSPPSSFASMGRQRASLDTLALTSDLSSYPLGFDRDEAMQHYPGRR